MLFLYRCSVYTIRMSQIKIFIYVVIGCAVLIGGGIWLNSWSNNRPAPADGLAQCLEKDGAKFYGAFWCPHCQEQKRLFGNSTRLLPYIECSKNDMTQTQVCIDAKIESYPTWMFKDGITITTPDAPVMCSKDPVDGEPATCTQNASKYFKRWIWEKEGYIIASTTDPVHTGTTWKFDAAAQSRGVLPFAKLNEQTQCPVPAQ